MNKILLTASALAVLFTAPVFAQTTPMTPPPPAGTAPPPMAAPSTAQPAAPASSMRAKPTAADKRAKSAACSKQADDQGLHGKKRHKFREDCKKSTT